MNPNIGFLDPFCNWARYFAALDLALMIAEVKHGFPGKATEARAALIRVSANGITGWVNVPNPEAAAMDYVSYVYDAAPIPFNLRYVLG